jgi:hypothetical protein
LPIGTLDRKLGVPGGSGRIPILDMVMHPAEVLVRSLVDREAMTLERRSTRLSISSAHPRGDHVVVEREDAGTRALPSSSDERATSCG